MRSLVQELRRIVTQAVAERANVFGGRAPLSHEALDFGVHALYADPKKPQEYAVALAMPMLYPELRNTLSRHGARFARREFGWSGIARRTLRVFAKFGDAIDERDFEEEAVE